MNYLKFQKIIIWVFIFFISFFIGACSAKMSNDTKINLSVEVLKSNAWVNLMPGMNMKPTFHLIGEVKIINNSGDIIKDINLQEVYIYSDSILVYKFIPEFKSKENDSTNSIFPSAEKIFTFNSPKGLVLKKELNQQKLCNALLKFSSEGKTIDCMIENIKIEKVY